MITSRKDDVRQLYSNWRHTISGIDIELKEKQFMNDEVEYYKEVKTKSRKNAHAEDRKLGCFR
jgi:hypothetical protein